jgi:hypothetical protein
MTCNHEVSFGVLVQHPSAGNASLNRAWTITSHQDEENDDHE